MEEFKGIDLQTFFLVQNFTILP